MNKLIFLTIFIFSSISLQAYSKNIVIAAMSTKKNALGAIKGIRKNSPEIYLLSKKYNFNFSVKKIGKYYLVLAGVFHNRKEIVITLKKVRKSYPGAYPAIATKIKNKVVVKKIKPIRKKEAVKRVVAKKNKPIKIAVVNKNISKVIVKKIQVKDKKQDVIVKEKVKTKSHIKKVDTTKKNKVVVKELKSTVKKEEKSIVKKEEKIQKKKVESKIKEVESESFFHWSYIVLLIFFVIFVFYAIKLKRIYDEY